ncbi:MAG: tetratricopeptide repeat protein, partial [Gammaproteobacteria bacterium]
MSLLLDALKKAAQEKQNAASSNVDTETTDELGLVKERVPEPPLADRADTSSEQPAELELEDVELALVENSVEIERPAVEDPPGHDYRQHHIAPTPSTVTDEALQLLIHKANNDYKKSRFITWGSVAAGTLILLTISGLYFYLDMVEEIDSMQKKHQIALAALKSKTRIEENLTSLAAVPESEQQSGMDKKPVKKTVQADKGSLKRAAGDSNPAQNSREFSVQRAEKRDPVSEALESGWLAYQGKDYQNSKREYEKVLDKEPHNHDALLGIAAVSLQLQDIDKAREIYLQLLERDPRDPHAHAGLANIAQTEGASLSESKLKQLIEHRPDDAHLRFALGTLYVQKKNWPEAQQAFFNAWKGDPDNPDYAYNLAVSLDHLGKHKEAKAFYEDSLKLATGKHISFSPDAV